MSTRRDANFWIEQLKLLAHPEGGFYKEIYRSELILDRQSLPDSFKGDRHSSTSIYYLLQTGDFSAFHRIASDELWHFYAGDCLEIFELSSSGKMITHLLGNNPEQGENLQVLITAGNWFASRPAQGTKFSLAGCTVSPGFDFEDFEIAERDMLLNQFPEHQKLLRELCRG